jgi:hypothetical protein
MATTLAEVLHRFGPEYLSHHALSSAQARAWRAIVACRTPALGGERLRCEGCHTEHWPALRAAEAAGELPRDPADASERRARAQALRRHDWVVYAKTPLAGPAAVLDYLSRYTHRTAIGHERLAGIQGDTVRLRVRADDHGSKRTISMPGEQFIARLLQHVLPCGFKRIRHYGLLAPCAKTERLAQARRLLAMPAANPQAQEEAQAFMKRVAGIEINTCPHCQGRWRVVEQRGADVLALRSLLPEREASCRGPP